MMGLIARVLRRYRLGGMRGVFSRLRERSRGGAGAQAEQSYADRIAREHSIFDSEINVHALPAIYHYWSNRYLLEMEREFGFDHPYDFFARELARQTAIADGAPLRFVSLGSGNCDAEVDVALRLRALGVERFVIECLDLSGPMLARGAALARERGVETQISPVEQDFNAWRPDRAYHGVMANQSLHHVLELEHLLDAVSNALVHGGRFVVSDMIGRNGHQRWPEALAIVHELWRDLPDKYRFNVQLQRHEHEFLDWDCSTEGFEGIRAQDILPLCIERFGFEMFLPFANVIDPFIDRGFGHHFDPAREWDRAFIDRVHARDEAEILAGNITPTHMMAIITNDRDAVPRVRAHLTPEFCVRRP
ncbi:MAG TPA: class I SAM-dependent methyltransferase [Candidatus Saccharimonadia bacterium]|nr:class I SAM-dependent methyltransferase [Candidatus Saccharimonadia bacterium]